MENNGTDLFIIIVLGFFLMLLMALSIIFMVIIHRQRQYKNKQELDRIQIEMEKVVLDVEKEIREETLAYVGKELHDNIGQLLSLTKIYLSSSKPEKVSEGKNMIDDVIQEVRTLSKTLNLEWVDSISLTDFIAAELKKLENSELCKTELIIDGNPKEPQKQKKLILIRTIQECLNNASKHAQPDLISVQLKEIEKGLILTIRDDGVGFDKEQQSNGMGMYNLKKRMEAINGQVAINSNPGSGTEIILTLP